jgi:hypothetical protein
MEQMTTAVQRTFSHDKYDAMEANIHYVDINEKGNCSPTSKKRKNEDGDGKRVAVKKQQTKIKPTTMPLIEQKEYEDFESLANLRIS